MPKQLLFLFSIAVLLSACKQIEEQKYTAREWDSITKARHEQEFDSTYAAYSKEHPKAFYPLHKEDKLHLIKTTIYDFEKFNITIEHRYFPRSCINEELLYVYNDSASQIIEMPWRSIRDTTHKLTALSSDFNSMIQKFKLKYDADFRFLDVIIHDHLHLRRLWDDEGPILSIYEENIRHLGGCEDLCFKNLSANIQKAKSLLLQKNMRVYTDGVQFIAAKVDYTNNVPKVEFEILNPECECLICM